MATISRIPVSEYLHEIYRPDRDYVDGEVQERNMGEKEHSAWQGALAEYFRRHRKEWGLRVYPELRVQVSPTRFRVPDLILLRRDVPNEQIITHPPLVCIEILSPEDRFGRIEERIADYLSLGVREVWVIDPVVVQGYRCKGANPRDWQQTNQLTVEGTPITVDLAEIVADLD
jgi:Uma2 family endonuclease